jgi:myo-inositol-1(or 4)-monophosphatase
MMISRETLLKTTQEAGAICSAAFRSLTVNQIHFKSEIDLVTEIDRQVQTFLIDRLTNLCPGARFLAEEQKSPEALTDDPTFIIDPVDGTTNFVHGLPYFCVSVGYTENRIPQLGVVVAPALNEVYSAQRGAGSFWNGQRILVSNNEDPRQALGCTGLFGGTDKTRQESVELMADVLLRLRDVRRMGAAALDLCYVAAGRFDLFWERSLNAWDIAAGALIVEEAGGIVSDLWGDTRDLLFAGNVLAANPALHKWFLELDAVRS